MTLDGLLHKAIAAGFAAATVGGGAMLLSVNKDNAVQDERLIVLEKSLSKLDDIDRTVIKVDGKVDVLNQKLDDAKEVLRGR
jgi:hypothetical protein